MTTRKRILERRVELAELRLYSSQSALVDHERELDCRAIEEWLEKSEREYGLQVLNELELAEQSPGQFDLGTLIEEPHDS